MTTIPAGILEGPARAVFQDIVRFYQVKPHALLRVLVELMLDHASEDGDLQRQLVEAALYCEQSGKVLGCWLNLEGGDEDAEPDEEEGGGDGDEDMDTGEKHDLKQVGRSVCATAGDDPWWN